MSKSVWTQAFEVSADPQRARHHFDLLAATSAARKLRSVNAEQAHVWATLLAGSQALSSALVAHPEWLEHLTLDRLRHPRRAQGFRREVEEFLRPALQARNYAGALGQLRSFKQREMLRIGLRDLARFSNVPEITREISEVADVCLSAVLEVCEKQLVERLGQPYHLDADGRWRNTGFSVLGMGKLGGQELNYSSDVDVIFVYDDEGEVFKQPPRKGSQAGRGLANHEFFKRFAEAFVAEVGRGGPESGLYRIDVRLRPEGDAGPLARSLSSCETYYAQWGQTWERLALMKARGVAGDAQLAAEFLEMIQPFRYPRSVNARVLREVAGMKYRLETEVVKTGEVDRNVKLGRGGIREIEFIVQAIQLVQAGRNPFLQGASTLATMEKLVQYQLLPEDDAVELREAYCFLRDLEHRLQMEDNQQTHTVPTQRAARERLAHLMDFESLAAFERRWKEHASAVRANYDRVLGGDEAAEENGLPKEFAGAEAAWKRLLKEHGFREPDTAYRMLNEFANGPGFVHVSARTVELAFELLPRLFALCPRPAAQMPNRPQPANSALPRNVAPILSDPDRVLKRLDSFIAAYGARALMFETWISHPSLFELLLLIFDRSEFLAETAIRSPDLLDELVAAGRLRQRKSSLEILEDLRHGHADKDQSAWIRRYHQVEFMRIGAREILGLADFEQSLEELSALADACLQYALEVVLRRRKLKRPPLVIIGLGKLGGCEITYGSDLDVMFVTEGSVKQLPKLQTLAVEVMDLLMERTEHGFVFNVDARLRPDGEKGLLVNTFEAYQDYYQERAQLWEIQAMTRTRPVAGDSSLGAQFQELMARLTNFAHPSQPLAAFTPNWKQEIRRMRSRIEKERTPKGLDHLAIKTGRGGLVDAEFVAQTICLEQGWQEANTLRALARAKHEGALPINDAEQLMADYRELRRVEIILRRWSYEGETVLPADPEPFQRVAVRCGFTGAEPFMQAVVRYREGIRKVYDKVLGAS